ncbi:MAG: helix-hairpin-helix domain-containing protein, partial [Parcubacteria group bacterium]
MKKISLYLTIALVILLSFSQSLLAQSTLVNINTASFEELQTLHNIGPIKAQAIIDYRTANDLFIYPDEIKNVTGIAEGIYDDIKDHITTGAKLVSGDISGDEVWSSVPGEFYALNGDVTVPAGSSLVVEADTVVMYDRGPFRKIIVAGNLTFSGEAESQITLERVGLEVLSEASFVSNHAKFTGPGGYGIYQIAGSVEVENSTFSAFNNGVLTTSGDLSLNSSTFESNTEYGINVSGSSTVELNNNIFS